MHVIGARFRRAGSARAALGALRVRLGVPIEDAAVRPLGSTHYEQPATDTLLAGRFEDSLVPDVIELVEAFGGRIVADRPEVIARPAASAPGGGRRADPRPARITARWTRQRPGVRPPRLQTRHRRRSTNPR